MYRSYQFLAKVKATSSGKLLDSLPWNDAVAELCSGIFNVVYCRDPAFVLEEYYQYQH
jgi:hypothetical protein